MTESSEKKLRTGFTTGAAAAAAVKAALIRLVSGGEPAAAAVPLLSGDGELKIPVEEVHMDDEKTATAVVIKDGGDDPDVTHKAEIGARVTLLNVENAAGKEIRKVIITGGRGVGRVTKAGLEIPPGEPAVNPGPRKMIQQAVDAVRRRHPFTGQVRAEIFVPDGEKLAKKTLNHRLGIVGGISILGTTGLVRPMSHDAYIATIRSAMSVARAAGLDEAVLTTGRRSERHAQALMPHLPEEAFIQIGDFFKMSLDAAVENEFSRVHLTVFFGKAVKMAQGVPHTHAAKSALTLHRLSEWALFLTEDQAFADEIQNANTARHAFDIAKANHSELIPLVGQYMIDSAIMFSEQKLDVHGVIFDFDGSLIFDSDKDKIQ